MLDHGFDFGLFRFGRFVDDVLDYSLAEIPLFFLVGVIGGAVGAFYIYASSKITFYRKRYKIFQVFNSGSEFLTIKNHE